MSRTGVCPATRQQATWVSTAPHVDRPPAPVPAATLYYARDHARVYAHPHGRVMASESAGAGCDCGCGREMRCRGACCRHGAVGGGACCPFGHHRGGVRWTCAGGGFGAYSLRLAAIGGAASPSEDLPSAHVGVGVIEGCRHTGTTAGHWSDLAPLQTHAPADGVLAACSPAAQPRTPWRTLCLGWRYLSFCKRALRELPRGRVGKPSTAQQGNNQIDDTPPTRDAASDGCGTTGQGFGLCCAGRKLAVSSRS